MSYICGFDELVGKKDKTFWLVSEAFCALPDHTTSRTSSRRPTSSPSTPSNSIWARRYSALKLTRSNIREKPNEITMGWDTGFSRKIKGFQLQETVSRSSDGVRRVLGLLVRLHELIGALGWSGSVWEALKKQIKSICRFCTKSSKPQI